VATDALGLALSSRRTDIRLYGVDAGKDALGLT
jgi:hypothetical protein